MKFQVSNLATYLLLSILLIDDVYSNPISNLMKLIQNQLSKRIPTKNNQFDESIVYAIPTPDGQGFILQGYGKPPSPYAYDNDVDIYQTKKMWSGQVKIPNFLPKESLLNERIIKGSDNRVGLRVAIPFLGDFQYLREIGPGRFTDNLGPGQFTYPGFNDRPKKLSHDYGNELDSYGNSYGPEVGPPPGYGDSYAGTSNEVGYQGDNLFSSESEQNPVYAEEESSEDPFEGLRNYPWNLK